MGKNQGDFIMLPTVDYCFKELMKNPKVRKGFIAALLGKEPGEIRRTRLLPTILGQSSDKDKVGILDIRVSLTDGTQIDMEMQVAYFEAWKERIVFYLGKMYTEQLNRGESYEKLKKCIHVGILNFNHFPEDDICYRTIHLREDRSGELYTDLLEIQVLELRKLPKDKMAGSDILAWMQFFNGKTRKEFANMAKKNKYLGEAYQTLVKLSANEGKRREYEAREKALSDYNTQISGAERRGEKRGEKRGREIARRVFLLDRRGKTPEEIAADCEIAVEEIKALLADDL